MANSSRAGSYPKTLIVPAAAAVDHLHHRGLAGPIGAQQTETRALLDLEAQIADGVHPAESLVDIPNAYDLHDPITGHFLSTDIGLNPLRPFTYGPPKQAKAFAVFYTSRGQTPPPAGKRAERRPQNGCRIST
jgi:hypothetical protein